MRRSCSSSRCRRTSQEKAGAGGWGQARLDGWEGTAHANFRSADYERGGWQLTEFTASSASKLQNFRVRFHRGWSGLAEPRLLTSLSCHRSSGVRAVKGGKKYLRRHYSSLAVCMSARYPRLGQNTPLVQRRERKKEKRESNKQAQHNSGTARSLLAEDTQHHTVTMARTNVTNGSSRKQSLGKTTE